MISGKIKSWRGINWPQWVFLLQKGKLKTKMRIFSRLIIWFLIVSFSGQYHSYISVKCLVTFSYYQAKALMSIPIYLLQSSIQDSSEFCTTSTSPHQPSSALPFTVSNFPSKGLLISCNDRPAYCNQPTQWICFSTRHRKSNLDRHSLYHRIEKFRVEVGFGKYGLTWRSLPLYSLILLTMSYSVLASFSRWLGSCSGSGPHICTLCWLEKRDSTNYQDLEIRSWGNGITVDIGHVIHS